MPDGQIIVFSGGRGTDPGCCCWTYGRSRPPATGLAAAIFPAAWTWLLAPASLQN